MITGEEETLPAGSEKPTVREKGGGQSQHSPPGQGYGNRSPAAPDRPISGQTQNPGDEIEQNRGKQDGLDPRWSELSRSPTVQPES